MKRLIVLSILLIILTISCSEKAIELNSSNIDNEIYYHRTYFCFDFVKKCNLEILNIKNLDTLIYVNTNQIHGKYEEIHCKLTKINDSIFYAKPYKHLIQKGNHEKPLTNIKDTILFYCDSSLIGNRIEIEYTNGEKIQHSINSTVNKFWINEQNFSKKRDFLYLTFNHKNPIVDELVQITSLSNEKKYSIIFKEVNNSNDFYIVLNNDKVFTLNFATQDHQNLGVKFNLARMNKDFKFRNGRKLYK